MADIPLIYKVKCWLYPRLNRFASHGGRFYEVLANSYKEYDKIYASPPSKEFASVTFIDRSQIVGLTFEEVCTWVAEYNASLQSALEEAQEEHRSDAIRINRIAGAYREEIATLKATLDEMRKQVESTGFDEETIDYLAANPDRCICGYDARNNEREPNFNCLIHSPRAQAKQKEPLLKQPNTLPEGCYCKPGHCMAPVVMGRQMPCRDPQKAKQKEPA